MSRPIILAANSSDAADYIWRRQVPTDVIVLTPGNYEVALQGLGLPGEIYTTEFARLSNDYAGMLREAQFSHNKAGRAAPQPRHLRAA